MEFKAFLIKYAEIGIKGNNRRFFEDALVRQMKYALKPVGNFSIRKESGRIFVHANEEYDFDEAVESLSHVFGIAGICPIVVEEDKDFEKIAEVVEKYVDEDYADKHFSFKVHVRRADKKYPIPSMEAAARLGERLLEKFEDLSVDVHNPDVMLTVEIRDKVYIYSASRDDCLIKATDSCDMHLEILHQLNHMPSFFFADVSYLFIFRNLCFF